MKKEELSADILAKAAKASEDLLPRKSRITYEKEFDIFMTRKSQNSVLLVTETVMMAYFQELFQKYKPSSLWIKYSILEACLIVNENVVISKYNRLVSFFKTKSKGYVSKKPKVLIGDQVLTFVKNVPDDIYLLHKVVLGMGVFGGLRRDKMVKMKIHDIEDKECGLLVDIPETKTGTSKGFTIVAEEEMEAFKLIRKYISLRPSGIFFEDMKKSHCANDSPTSKVVL